MSWCALASARSARSRWSAAARRGSGPRPPSTTPPRAPHPPPPPPAARPPPPPGRAPTSSPAPRRALGSSRDGVALPRARLDRQARCRGRMGPLFIPGMVGVALEGPRRSRVRRALRRTRAASPLGGLLRFLRLARARQDANHLHHAVLHLQD